MGVRRESERRATALARSFSTLSENMAKDAKGNGRGALAGGLLDSYSSTTDSIRFLLMATKSE